MKDLSMHNSKLHLTTTASFDGSLKFPQIVQILMEEGVESYQVDLIQNLKTFYFPTGEVQIESFDYKGPEIALEFSQEKVIAAIRSSQAGRLSYPEFLNEILKAGVTQYTVYLQGRRAIYFGRLGDFHVEHFPQ